MKTAIVTDSTAYLSSEEYAQTGIKRVPLSVIMEGKAFREEVDLTAEEFYKKLDEAEQIPTSSQPTVGDFFTVYQELADAGYEAIISIHISAKLSGTFQNASSVASSFESARIYPYDSERTSGAQAILAMEAAKMAQEGKNPQEILDRLDELKDETQLFFVVDDLKNLVKGGRLSSAAGTVGTLLKIKPVLTLEEGLITVYDKIRTQKKALSKIEEILSQDVQTKDYAIQAIVVHGDVPERAESWKKELEEKFPEVSFEMGHLGPVIGVHTGRGALGMVWTKKTK